MIRINCSYQSQPETIVLVRGLTTLTLYGRLKYAETPSDKILRLGYELLPLPSKEDHAEFVIDTAANYFNDSQHDQGKWHVEV